MYKSSSSDTLQHLYKNFSFEANKLAEAAAKGDIEAVQSLLLECTTISINEKDSQGCTALYRAVENNNFDIAKLLLELEVCIKFRDDLNTVILGFTKYTK